MYMYLKRQTNDSDSNEYSRHAVHVRVGRALSGAIHGLERQFLVEQGGLTTHGGRTQLVLLGCQNSNDLRTASRRRCIREVAEKAASCALS